MDRDRAFPTTASLRGLTRGLLTLSLLLGVGGCDFSVTNPGRSADAELDDPAARAPLVSGMKAALSSALWRVSFVGAEVTREYVQGGRIFTTKLPTRSGQLTREDISSAFWNYAVRARWIAEDGIRRFREHDPDFDRSESSAEALIYAGFANRLLGENFCEAVIDGGAPEPRTVYFDRAERHFTEALGIATSIGRTDLAEIARAGRATVRVHLGDWDGAVGDASEIGDEFVFQAEALLRKGDATGALAIINRLRSTLVSDHDGRPLGLRPETTDLEEAWTYLKEERAIELWLEGRRLGDIRRWTIEGVPGRSEDLSDRVRLCFPIAQSEIDTNPNIELQHDDPRI